MKLGDKVSEGVAILTLETDGAAGSAQDAAPAKAKEEAAVAPASKESAAAPAPTAPTASPAAASRGVMGHQHHDAPACCTPTRPRDAKVSARYSAPAGAAPSGGTLRGERMLPGSTSTGTGGVSS